MGQVNRMFDDVLFEDTPIPSTLVSDEGPPMMMKSLVNEHERTTWERISILRNLVAPSHNDDCTDSCTIHYTREVSRVQCPAVQIFPSAKIAFQF